jgi:hypothetical protein
LSLISLIFAALVSAAFPIVRRADVPDSKFLELGARYPAVVSFGRLGDATLVHSRWLVTAAHVARGLERGRVRSVRLGGRDHMIAGIVIHPAWRELGPHDVALVFLAQPVSGVTPIPLSRDSSESGQVAVLVGHGASGTGNSRVRTEDGRRRGATSRVDSVDRNSLYFSFDPPPLGTSHEGAPGAGDSGGPAMIIRNGIAAVAGISSAATDGRDGPGTYGAVDVFTRISTHRRWLDSVIARGAPVPAAASRSSASTADTVLPSTPAGRHMAAFLQSSRESNGAVERFVREHFEPREIESRPALVPNMLRIAGMLSNARIEEVVKSEDLEVSVRFATPSGPLTLAFVCSETPPYKLLDWRRYD